jgi:hypothetical protein
MSVQESGTVAHSGNIGAPGTGAAGLGCESAPGSEFGQVCPGWSRAVAGRENLPIVGKATEVPLRAETGSVLLPLVTWLQPCAIRIQQDLPVWPERGTIQSDGLRHGRLLGPTLPRMLAACSWLVGANPVSRKRSPDRPCGTAVLIAELSPWLRPRPAGPASSEGWDRLRSLSGMGVAREGRGA